VLAGGAAIGVVVMAVMGVLALDKHNVVHEHCPGGLCDRAGFDAADGGRTFGHVASVAMGVGVASVAGAAILLWPRPNVWGAAIVPRLGGAGVEVGTKF
jgi:hypothetical protein